MPKGLQGFQKGHGTFLNNEHYNKLKIIFKNRVKENNPNWKGDNVSYAGLHTWIRRNLGNPQICYNCGSEDDKYYDWANISGEYKRDLTDWVKLCRKCHSYFDDNVNKSWIVRKSKIYDR